MKLVYLKPDSKPLKKISKDRLLREMLKEAIGLLFLESEYNSEAALRTKIKNTVLKRLHAEKTKGN